jgi:hypothetical protein
MTANVPFARALTQLCSPDAGSAMAMTATTVSALEYGIRGSATAEEWANWAVERLNEHM